MITENEIIQIISGFLGAIGFSVIFNVRGKKMLVASLGAILSWGIFVLLGCIIPSEPVRYFIVAMIISLYSEIMARILKTPTTTFHMTALIPLVPGASLYYTMVSAFEGDFEAFGEKALHTIGLMAALALGIIIVSAITKIVVNILSASRKRKREKEGA